MNMGHHVLPSARKADPELKRYVRSEYREGDPCWFSLSCMGGGGQELAQRVQPEAPRPQELGGGRAGTAARCCPVMGALSGGQLTKGLAPRGELTGER